MKWTVYDWDGTVVYEGDEPPVMPPDSVIRFEWIGDWQLPEAIQISADEAFAELQALVVGPPVTITWSMFAEEI